MSTQTLTLPLMMGLSPRRVWRLATAALLLAASALSYYGAFWLRFEFDLNAEDWSQLSLTLPLLIAFRLISFYYFRLDRRPLNTASSADLLPIAGSIFSGSALFALFTLTVFREIGYPRSVFLIDALLLNAMLLGIYSSVRVYQEVRGQARTNERRVLVVGDGPALLGVLRDVKNSGRWHAVGVITSDPNKKGLELLGVRVEGTFADLFATADRLGVDLLCFANPGLGQRRLLNLTATCRQQKREFVLLRSHSAVPESAQAYTDDVSIEVILQREQVEIDLESVGRFIQGKRVLVTGAGGSIGGELCRQIASFGPAALYLLERSENNLFYINREIRQLCPELAIYPLLVDITDEATVNREFAAIQPELVFHAAAFKHVGMMEERPSEAIRNNVLGTSIVARAAVTYGAARFINISTDKAVRPTSYMGLSKRLAEMVIEELNAVSATNFITVRFGNVAGSAGSVVPLFEQQIRQGGPVTVTDKDAERFFMSIPEAVRLVLQAAVFGEAGGIFVLEMGKPVRIHDLANTMIALAGFLPGVDIPIQITGLGAGDKLAEELEDDDEETEPTAHERVRLIRKKIGRGRREILPRLERWKRLLASGEPLVVLQELPEIWPETTQVRRIERMAPKTLVAKAV
jgi:FlaA1/EpsC-like NDP-sugar epimerase